jgi:hypothetical protein
MRVTYLETICELQEDYRPILFLSVSAQITPVNTQRGIIPADEPDNVALSTDHKLTQT